jgi:hypothetical protein
MSRWLLGLFGGLFLFGASEVRRFENAAARDVRSKLQGDAKVSVRIRPAGISGALASATIRASNFTTDGLPLFTEPDRSTRGRVQELRLMLTDFVLRGLRVESLEAKIPDCRFDYALAVRRGQIRLSRSGTGTGNVVVLEKDLEAFILRKYREIKRVTVLIDRGRVKVSGHGEFIILAADFEVDAALAAPEGNKLALVDTKITLNGAPADPFASQALLKILNPVVDFNRDLGLYDAIKVERIVLEDGTLQASGATRIPDLPQGTGDGAGAL